LIVRHKRPADSGLLTTAGSRSTSSTQRPIHLGMPTMTASSWV